MKRNRTAVWLWSLLLAQLLAGCAGYQLGPTNGRVSGGKSIQVNPFASKVMEPRLSEALTSAVRKQLQQDGTFQLDTRDEGGIIVSGTITHYDRGQLSFQPGDVVTPRDYAISIIANVMARDRASGKVLLDRNVTGRTTIRVGSDLTSAERQALPLAAEDLARSITSLLVDGEW